MTDAARRVTGQWIALDVNYAGSPLAVRLMERFGPAGPLAWINFLCACKRSPTPGSVAFSSEAEALAILGLTGVPLVDIHGSKWDLETFWRTLGQLKQTKRTRRGHVVNVRATHWQRWQDDSKREAELERKRRWWLQNKGQAASSDTSALATGLDAKTDLKDRPLSPPPPSSKPAVAPAPPDSPPRRGRRTAPSNGHGEADVVTGAVAVLAARRLDIALADAAAGRREPIHHRAAWVAAALADLDATATSDLELLAAAERITDPAALADAYTAKTTPAASPPPGPCIPPLTEPARCPACAELTFDCVCR